MFGVILATATALLAYLYTIVQHKRFRQFAHLPQLPNTWLWGHMKAFGEFGKLGPRDEHPETIMRRMHASIGDPSVMFIDFRPFSHPGLLIRSHDVAEQLSRGSKLYPWSVPKYATQHGQMVPVIGKHSIITKEGAEWKDLRRRFNPGFAPAHLNTLLPVIMDKVDIFLGQMDDAARTGETIVLGHRLRNLTFDIMGAVVLDEDLRAQELDPARRGALIQIYGTLLETYNDTRMSLPWWLRPRVTWYRNRLSKQLDKILSATVRAKFAEGPSASDDSRSILALSLKNMDTLTPRVLDETVDQIKSFLFAGHDTTTVLLEWAIYELSRTPKAMQAVKGELDAVLGPDTDPAAIRAQLLSPQGPELLNRLTYLSAVIKETLRHRPPAGSSRYAPYGTGLTIRIPESKEEINVDGLMLYLAHDTIHHDAAVYGDTAEDFVPERWLGNAATDTEDAADGAALPATAWRPFERGPRNCIGQQLVNIEARIILACVARRYDFVKVGVGKLVEDAEGRHVLNEKGYYEAESEIYTTLRIITVPVGHMEMKVKFIS
jgi:cytochrome P450